MEVLFSARSEAGSESSCARVLLRVIWNDITYVLMIIILPSCVDIYVNAPLLRSHLSRAGTSRSKFHIQ